MATVITPFLSLGANGALGPLVSRKPPRGRHVLQSRPPSRTPTAPGVLTQWTQLKRAGAYWREQPGFFADRAEWSLLASTIDKVPSGYHSMTKSFSHNPPTDAAYCWFYDAFIGFGIMGQIAAVSPYGGCREDEPIYCHWSTSINGPWRTSLVASFWGGVFFCDDLSVGAAKLYVYCTVNSQARSGLHYVTPS